MNHLQHFLEHPPTRLSKPVNIQYEARFLSESRCNSSPWFKTGSPKPMTPIGLSNYPDFHVFLQFLSIKSDKKKSQSTSPGSSRVCGSAVRKKVAAVKPSLLAVSFAFTKPPMAIEPNFWKKKIGNWNWEEKQGCLVALHWLTLQAQTRNFRGLTWGGLRTRCISRYRLWFKKAAWIWLVTTLHCVTTSVPSWHDVPLPQKSAGLPMPYLSAACRKQRLPQLLQQESYNRIRKKKKNYYSTLKLPQLLNFVYFKVEEKVERVQKLVNCKSKQLHLWHQWSAVCASFRFIWEPFIFCRREAFTISANSFSRASPLATRSFPGGWPPMTPYAFCFWNRSFLPLNTPKNSFRCMSGVVVWPSIQDLAICPRSSVFGRFFHFLFPS